MAFHYTLGDVMPAECQDGVLTIHLPMQPQAERSRRIEVQGGSEAGSPRLQSQGQAQGSLQPTADQEGRGAAQATGSEASAQR